MSEHGRAARRISRRVEVVEQEVDQALPDPTSTPRQFKEPVDISRPARRIRRGSSEAVDSAPDVELEPGDDLEPDESGLPAMSITRNPRSR